MKNILLVILACTIAVAGNAGEPVRKKVLLEHFSTQTCVFCPEATELWKEVIAENEHVIWVIHHTGNGSDDFTISESEAYHWFYGGSLYAPASMLNRTDLRQYGASASGKGPVFYPDKKVTLNYLIKKATEIDPVVSVHIKRTYDAKDRKAEITISGDVVGDLPDNPRVTVYLTENGIVSWQQFPNSSIDEEYELNHVMRAVLTDKWGDAVSFADGAYSATYTFTIPEEWNADNMDIVAFVSNYDSGNYNNSKVCNVEVTGLVENNGIEVLSLTPSDNATAVAIDTDIRVTFNENISSSELSKITIMPAPDNVSASVNDNALTISCNALAYETTYIVTIPGGTVDGYGEAINWSFTTVADGVGNIGTIPDGIMIYPNPAKEIIYLNHLPENSIVTLYSLSGKMLNRYEASHTLEIPLSLKQGMYLLKIEATGLSLVKKLLIE